MNQFQAQIYLSDQRGLSQLDWFRSLHTFNFGAYFDTSRQPFGALQVFNEDSLAAEKRFSMQVEADTYVVIIPLVGGVDFIDSNGKGHLVAIGESLTYKATKGTSFEIANPFQKEYVSFLHIWLKTELTNTAKSIVLQEIDFQRDSNRLLSFFDAKHLYGVLGKYDGRNEDTYILQNPNNGVFAYVLNGAFEFQNRLLHAGDGLALSSINEIEFEALSNDAVILILETPL